MVVIFFINPPDDFLEKKGDRPPLGLMYLSSYVKKLGHLTKIYDLNHDSLTILEEKIFVEKPEFLCFSVSITSHKWSVDFIKKIKSKGFCGKIIAGGNHVTNIPTDTILQECCDFLVVGDGELAIEKILNYETNEKIVRCKDIDDLDKIPFPDYEGVDMNRYGMTVEGKKGALIVSSRGCVYSCAYCGSSKIRKIRQRSPINVLNEMKLLYDKYGIRGFYFGDDIFTFNSKRTIELCNLIKENLKDIIFRVTTRSDLLTPEVCVALKESGCNIVCIGFESGNNDILKLIKKNETTDIQRKGVEMCHDAGLKVKGFFIIGLPGETRKTALETIQFAKSLNLEYVDCYPITPYPNTPLWDNPEQYGMKIIKPTDGNWNDYYQVGKSGADHEIKVIHNNLSNEEIKELVNLFNEEINKKGLTY